MAGRDAANRLQTVGDYIDDPHVTCLDTFSLNPVPVSNTPGPLEAFCQIPSDNPHRDDPVTITLAPGIDIVDLYSTSEKTDVWINDGFFECLVPSALQGWEFFTVLHPKPDGAAPVLLNPGSGGPGIELLFGRPPGSLQCPSILFIVVPAGQQYQREGAAPHQASIRHKPPGRARGKPGKTPSSYEKACGNLDGKGQSICPRLLALCPSAIYDEATVLPDGAGWGLFVGPRHRRLLLLNKTKGRIDVHLIMLFSIDAVFQRCRALIDATARLYKPFGTQEQAIALFSDFDPLKAHCGLTNAVIADHINASLDGRDDFRRLLGVWPLSFFVSNSSDNLRFLTPLEVQNHRTGREKNLDELPVPHKLEDFPQWVVGPGAFEAEHRTALRKYRTRVIPRANPNAAQHKSWRGGVLQLLGLHGGGVREEGSWGQIVDKFSGCAEVTFGGSSPWQEPGSVINARPSVPSSSASDEKGGPTVNAPALVDSASALFRPSHSVHWRHSLDLIPGSDVVAKAPPQRGSPDAFAAPIAALPAPDDRMSDAVAATLQPPP